MSKMSDTLKDLPKDPFRKVPRPNLVLDDVTLAILVIGCIAVVSGFVLANPKELLLGAVTAISALARGKGSNS